MDKHVSLRIPEELLARFQVAAERDRRSLNGEILWLAERTLDRNEDGAR